MILAVASGKGGTGKTTVAVNLALAVSEQTTDHTGSQVILLDCDVEEPNAALFLEPTIVRRREVGVLVPDVRADQCTGCGRCAQVCQYHAVALVKGRVLVFPELCHGCGSCSLCCPEGALSEKMRVTGAIERGIVSASFQFAQGILNVGEAMAVPVIRQLKRSTIPRDSRPHLVILDAPPGTSCPVVETLRGSDLALLVTEPTPFGLHDLQLAVEVARGELRLPVAVVINRDGVGDQGVERYCQAKGIPVVMRIPMDRRIAEAYAEGHPLLEALPEYRQRFLDLYQRVQEVAKQ
jgi:MinD superfamily P-loop ATPase